jgi:hypothetical protein
MIYVNNIFFQGGLKMKQLYRFFLYFLVFLIIGLIFNAIFKHNLNILTAFSVALGVSLGTVFWGKKAQSK